MNHSKHIKEKMNTRVGTEWREREEEVQREGVRCEVQCLEQFRRELISHWVGGALMDMHLLSGVEGEEHAVRHQGEGVVEWQDVHGRERGDHLVLDGQVRVIERWGWSDQKVWKKLDMRQMKQTMNNGRLREKVSMCCRA